MQDAGRAPTTTPLPGTKTSCALLTLLTILMAWPSPTALSVWVRPAYFALLSWFFWRATRGMPELRGQPLRLVRSGFLVLFASFTISATIHVSGLDERLTTLAYLRAVCEHGALLLLGTTLLSYGMMLWIPHVLASHQLLDDEFRRQQGELRAAETARSHLEERLVDADRRGMLGELAASIAHDLRNPLTIVKGTAESLCRRPRSQAEIAEHTAIIQRNIDKADKTIGALIDLARPRRAELEPVDPLGPLQEIVALLRVEAKRRRIDLRIGAMAADLPPVHTDRMLLIQVLLNLVLNALQASPAPGHVTVTARRRGDAMLLLVADRGSGLPDAVRHRLFTPFFTTKSTGTGLGLASCRRIAGELGGSVRLYPRHRGGARAVLALPLRQGNGPASASIPATADGERQWAGSNC